MNPLSTLRSRIANSVSRRESSDLRQHLSETLDTKSLSKVQEISSCTLGSLVEIVGTVKIVAIRPQDQSPAVEIQLADHSGVVNVIWLGRRRIPGIVAGRTMKVCGRLAGTIERPTIFNPRYELQPMHR